MKIQSYYFNKKSENAQKVAERIAREYTVKADQLPPAYQPEREAVLFITFESGKVDEKLSKFCKSLNVNKAKTVAFGVVGKDKEGLDELKKIVTDCGLSVWDDVYFAEMKGGLFSKGKLTDEQLSAGLAWAKGIVAKITE